MAPAGVIDDQASNAMGLQIMLDTRLNSVERSFFPLCSATKKFSGFLLAWFRVLERFSLGAYF